MVLSFCSSLITMHVERVTINENKLMYKEYWVWREKTRTDDSSGMTYFTCKRWSGTEWTTLFLSSLMVPLSSSFYWWGDEGLLRVSVLTGVTQLVSGQDLSQTARTPDPDLTTALSSLSLFAPSLPWAQFQNLHPLKED